MGSLEVSLASLDGRRRITAPLDGWGLLEFEGWDDLPGLRGSSAPRPLGDGNYTRTQTYREGLSGTLVMVYESTASDVARQAKIARGILAGPVEITVTDHDGEATSRRVDIAKMTVQERHTPDERLKVALVWDAADPVAYGPAVPRLTGETVRNLGTMPVSPVITITGPVAAGVVITEVETGRVMRWAGTLRTGQVLRLDRAQVVAMVDGAPSLQLRRTDWPLVPPGEQRTYLVSPSVGARMTIFERSGW